MLSPLELFNRAVATQRTAHVDVALSVEEGRLPPALTGVLFRNGPGQMVCHGVPYRHLFDGDGMVQRFFFDGGQVRYTNRMVDTPELAAEAAAGRMLYRSFGTNRPGGVAANALRFHFKNAGNTSVLPLGDRLLALWEGGSPYVLDPVTLESGGLWQNDGFLREKHLVEKLMGNGRPFSAHPKLSGDGRWIGNFGLSPGLRQRLLLHRVPLSGDEATTREVILPRLTFIHDFVLTAENQWVFLDVPVAFHLGKAFLGLASPAQSIFGREGDPAIIRVFADDGTSRTAETDACYVFHFPNGYASSEGEGRVTFDACRMSAFPSPADVAALLGSGDISEPVYAYLTRFDVDLDTGTVSVRRLSDYPMELPTINPAYRGRKHRFVWGVAEKPGRGAVTMVHGIAKVDTRTGITTYRDFYPEVVGEPFFVAEPRTGASEDSGWLLCLGFDPEKTKGFLRILNAENLETVATLALPEPVHPGFHGAWTPEG